MGKIKTIDELIEKLSKLYKYDIWVHAYIQKKHSKHSICDVDIDHNTVTFRLESSNEIPWIDISKGRSLKSFRYFDKNNLYYSSFNEIKNRLILEKPTYDQVYEFIFYQYVCPLAIEEIMRSYDNCKNNIFKRKK